MSSDETAVKVENLSKCFALYESPRDRLKQFIFPRVQRSLGRSPARYYREFWALRDVTLEVKKGETVGIVGRNGSGKSTLLQLICGTLTPTYGRVETSGRLAALLELGSGFNPEFTGRENIYMNAAVLGLTTDQIEARFDRIASFADIGDFIEQPMMTYSSGMVMRLAFAVMANVDADILVIDEALAVGDAFFVQKCMRFLRSFMERGTVLFVSHDTAALINLCGRAIWLHQGSIRQAGTPREIADGYLAALYDDTRTPNVPEAARIETVPDGSASLRDMRLEFVNSTSLRNDVELFRFRHDAPSFGSRRATIVETYFTDLAGHALSWVIGGEEVSLVIRCRAEAQLDCPIVGFFVKDRLGQTVFGDNTYLSYRSNPITLPEGRLLEASFQFRMPVLPVGDYSVCVAIADGTQEAHTQQHWIHDALIFTSHSSSVSTGLVGIPMKNIRLGVV